MNNNEQTLLTIREKIDLVDEKIQELINERASYILDVAKIKLQENPNPVIYRPEREAQKIADIQRNNKGPMPTQDMVEIFLLLMAKARDLQKKMQEKFGTFHQKSQQHKKIKQLAIIGLGLIGGSIAKAAKSYQLCDSIIAYDNLLTSVEYAKKNGIIDTYSENITDVVKNADLIVLAVPVKEFPQLLEKIKTANQKNSPITDVGSIKKSQLTSAEKILGADATYFVPGHPIAGAEKSGIEAAQPYLFENCLVILTPSPNTDLHAINTVEHFWQALGATVEIMDADLHDQLFAATSHLIQLLVFIFMNQIAENKYFPEILNYTGRSFKDFTRIAASSPKMWVDICLENSSAILNELEKFKIHIDNLQRAIQNQDSQKLTELFQLANQTKSATR